MNAMQEIFSAPEFDAAARCEGVAREFFLAAGYSAMASACGGWAPGRWGVAAGASPSRLVIEIRDEAGVVRGSQVVTDPEHGETGKLRSFRLDGRSLGSVVRRFHGAGGRCWLFARMVPTYTLVVLASDLLPPRPLTVRRGRSIDTDGEITARSATEELVARPGAWKVPGGWVAQLAPPRRAALAPADIVEVRVRGLSVHAMTFSPTMVDARRDEVVGATAEEQLLPDEFLVAVERLVPRTDVDGASEIAAVAFGLLNPQGRTLPPRSPSPQELEAAIREAATLLGWL